MKILTNQSYPRYGSGFTTIALDGLIEANEIVKDILGKPAQFEHTFKDCMSILRANKHYKAPANWQGYSDMLEDCLQEIEHGDLAVNEKAVALCEEYFEQAKLIEPSLTRETSFRPSEEGEHFDAGKIAQDEPMAFFNRSQNDQVKQGRGDGAFRIVINTDVSWWGDPSAQCGALMAIVLLLQRASPVEIWVQQGWLRNSSSDGVTLFKIYSGGVIQPQHLYFWIGSKCKDSPYSFAINHYLGRKGSGVSESAELPCDLYIYGQFMPRLKDNAFANWIAQTSRQLLFDEELPDAWTGYSTTLPPQ